MDHHRVTREGQETAALYALGALSQREALAFDVHLREGCSSCEAELKEFHQVVGILGAAAAPIAPPAYLRDLLAVRIEKEIAEARPAATSVLPFPEQAGTVHRRPAPARASFGLTLLPWAVAAALLIALAYTFTAWQTERRSLQAANELNHREAYTTADKENAELKEQLGKESARSAELTEINSVLSSPRWRIIPLEGQQPTPGSSAKVYWDVQRKRWVVTADLPPAPEGKVYQVWVVTPNAKISAGLIKPNDSGHGFTVAQLPSGVTQIAAAAITLEPEGGSEQPTMPIYVVGKT